MIARLRKTHRVIIGVIASALPLAFIPAVLDRPDDPRAERMPAALSDLEIAAPSVLWERDDLWGELRIVTRWRGDHGGNPVAVELELAALLRRPGVLLYWSPTTPTDPEALPAASHLLGAVGGFGARRYALPEAAKDGDGHLLLYSLGHDGVFATAALPAGAGGDDR